MTKSGRLVYLANARLPTEKAHGYQIVKMCEAFAKAGLDVQLWHPSRRQQDPALEGLSVFEFYDVSPVFRVRALPNWDVVSHQGRFSDSSFAPAFIAHEFFWALYAAFKARGESADFYYTRESALAFWATSMGLPTVYEAHAPPTHIRRWLLERSAGRPALIAGVALTRYVKASLVEFGLRPEMTLVLPDAVDLSMFGDLPSRDECRRRLKLPSERAIVGYLGRFQTMGMEKGISDLIHSFPLIEGGEKTPMLLFIGGPAESIPHYLGMGQGAGLSPQSVRFVERVPNAQVPLWLKAFDVAVMPFPSASHYSYYMSPLKLFEYMAAGIPIVATDLPALREILRHGENAWLVPPGDPEALARGISRVLRDAPLSKALSERAALDVRNYTWDRRAAAVLRALRDDLEAVETGLKRSS